MYILWDCPFRRAHTNQSAGVANQKSGTWGGTYASLVIKGLTRHYINPLITNDTYIHQIIAYAYMPMTHMYVKDESTHFNGIFGWYLLGQQL